MRWLGVHLMARELGGVKCRERYPGMASRWSFCGREDLLHWTKNIITRAVTNAYFLIEYVDFFYLATIDIFCFIYSNLCVNKIIYI